MHRRCHRVRVISFSVHCPENIHWIKKNLYNCIQWTRRIDSSHFIPNFVHAAQVYNRANGCSPRRQMKECALLHLACHVW